MVLNDRERQEVRSAVLEYLKLCGVTPEVLNTVEHTPLSSQEGVLDKRWSTIRRLSAKNVELESQVRSLQQELTSTRGGNGGRVGAAASGSSSSSSNVSFRPLVPSEHSLATLRGHRDTITSVSFHPLEALCFSSSEDGSVRVWDTSAMILATTLRPHTDTVNQVTVEPRLGDVFATCSNDRTIKLFKARSGQNSGGGAIQYDCTRSLLGHEEPVSTVCWLGDEDTTLISGSRNGDIRLWDIDKCVTRRIIQGGGWIRQIQCPVLQPQHIGYGKLQTPLFASCGNDDHVTVRNATGDVVASIGGHENVVHAIAFSNFEADCIITEHHGSDKMKRAIAEFKASAAKNSRREISTSLANGEIVHLSGAPQASNEKEIVVPYDVKYIATGGRDKTIRVFDMSDSTSSPILTLAFHENWVRALHFTRSGRYLVSAADDGFMLVSDLTNGRLHRRIQVHDHFATAMAFSSDAHETLVVTGSADTTLKLWRCS
ncbi:WD40 repeat-containing protein, putative [Bodo saltans]|uniref:WD40 repeat-containing protein, putative n=1 Tax=Bodo saltans TaxID=75058 RepID=A0A0S4ITM8_BODSA|nr:WD40 repeat-containing protein, putative [Bodo saltans]|eukprot:CUE76636.1 WD40 repeat-containing protein, putative [Bodo saltans]